MRRAITLAVVAGVVLVGASPAAAAGRVQELPVPAGTSTLGSPRVNGGGYAWTVSTSSSTHKAVVWHRGTPRVLEPDAVSSTVHDVNDRGLAAGSHVPRGESLTRAAVWQDGRRTDVGGPYSQAVAVGEDGRVLVTTYVPERRERLEVWQRGRSEVLYEGPQGGGYPLLGDGGHVVHNVVDANGDTVVREWDKRGRVVADLKAPAEYYGLSPLTVNRRGDIAFQTSKGYPNFRVLVWQDGVFSDPGSLPYAQLTHLNYLDPFFHTFLNDRGELAYVSGNRVFRWHAGVLTDLTPDAGYGDLPYIAGINNRGDIAARYTTADGTARSRVFSRDGTVVDVTGLPGSTRFLISGLNPDRKEVVGIDFSGDTRFFLQRF
ncbi:hypothetical protein [Actinokineospora spheciospongiae]|uniref:hypothetical protein n=1 Tax=Actinokineospora spheciospongiae TaxID=909613 RepID=UPI000D70E8B1|nr:hypothetical protein [Actinokineospora spheciospongiae]PWW59611.1 hypothetical protein DFQ13_108248 [Actinokineospora spheciospongiae]